MGSMLKQVTFVPFLYLLHVQLVFVRVSQVTWNQFYPFQCSINRSNTDFI